VPSPPWEAIDEDISVASLLCPEKFMRLPEPPSHAEAASRALTPHRACPGSQRTPFGAAINDGELAGIEEAGNRG